MPQIFRSPAAGTDVIEAAAYIARDNFPAAIKWIDTIDEKLRLLSEFPGLGTAREELATALRSFPVGNYLIFYRPLSDGIEVVRVLHGARDLRRIFRRT